MLRNLLRTARKYSRPLFLALTLSAALPACATTRPIAHQIDDASIQTSVKTALLNDPQVNATNIAVAVANGVVTISGPVRSAAEAQRAVQVARQVQGVRDVHSELKVGG